MIDVSYNSFNKNLICSNLSLSYVIEAILIQSMTGRQSFLPSRNSIRLTYPEKLFRLVNESPHLPLQNFNSQYWGRMATKQSPITVGVLALQGAFVEHLRLLNAASQTPSNSVQEWNFLEVRHATELAQCDALIIPGGESTTMALVAERSNILEPLREFVKYSGVSVHEILS